ncbi:MAG: trigger factor, partial [Rickettsiales bacterium]
MQVTELESKGLKKNFKIIVAADAIKVKTETELKEVGKTAKIAGFRSGQVPMKILQQRYGKAVQADVIKKVINGSVNELVVNNKFRPTLSPQINIEEYNEGGELSFSVALELFPDLPELAFDDVTLERKTFEITQADIDEAAERIAQRSPQFVDLAKGAKAENGNVVKIDFKGTLDGVAFDGGTAEDFDLELGSKQFIDGFEDQLIGAKAGDKKTVKVTFPDKYPSAQLAGKEVEFAVTIKAVQESKTPEINEEFATSRGFADLAAFHDAVRGQLIKEYDGIVRNQLKKQLFDILENKYTFDLPESMVEMEFNTIWERV